MDPEDVKNSLDEYIAQAIKELDEMRELYIRGNKRYSWAYPLEMDEIDWVRREIETRID